MKCAIVIPARIGSTRFPRKPLALISGKPMILHVCDRLKNLGIDIFVATDDEDIATEVYLAGYEYIMTPDNCKTGTDRVYRATWGLDYDFYINVQGDEPLVNPEDVQTVIDEKKKHPHYIICSKSKIVADDLENPNVVKVKPDGTLTRKPIRTDYRQCGIYAYSKPELTYFCNMPPKEVEGIEMTRIPKGILRFVEITGSQAVDCPDDIDLIEKLK